MTLARRGKRRRAEAPRSLFPTRSVLLDACALIRLHKCDALESLEETITFLAAAHAHGEFRRRRAAGARPAGAPACREAPHTSGSPEWDHFTLIRRGFSTVDLGELGEDESIAVALAEADRGNQVPIVTYDDGAARKARGLGIAIVSFLETLAWIMTCGLLTEEQAVEIEERAAARDGWRRPQGQVGPRTDLVRLLPEALESAPRATRRPRR
jgi:hypothetical protein